MNLFRLIVIFFIYSIPIGEVYADETEGAKKTSSDCVAKKIDEGLESNDIAYIAEKYIPILKTMVLNDFFPEKGVYKEIYDILEKLYNYRYLELASKSQLYTGRMALYFGLYYLKKSELGKNKKDLEKAIKYLEDSINSVSEGYLFLALANYMIGDTEKYILLLRESVDSIERQDFCQSADALSKRYSIKKDFSLAYYYSQIYLGLREECLLLQLSNKGVIYRTSPLDFNLMVQKLKTISEESIKKITKEEKNDQDKRVGEFKKRFIVKYGDLENFGWIDEEELPLTKKFRMKCEIEIK